VPVGAQISGKVSGASHGPAVQALAPLGDGRVAVAVRAAEELRVWEVGSPATLGDPELRPRRVLLRVPAPAGTVQALSAR